MGLWTAEDEGNMGHPSTIADLTVYFVVDIPGDEQIYSVDELLLADKLNEYQDNLRDMEYREGSLVFRAENGDLVSIVDDLDAMVQNLCFDCISVLLDERRECFLYRGMSSPCHIVVIPVGPLMLIIGDEIVTIRGTQQALLPALFHCGLRYLDLLKKLGLDEHIQYLQGFAEQARAALVSHGFSV